MKASEPTVQVPFDIQPGTPATRQVADGIRDAIRSGHWKPGDTLPRAKDFQGALGVGGYVPRTALRQLADEGTIVLKRHVGAVVPRRIATDQPRRIAFITSGSRDSYYENVHAFTLQEIFARSGYDLVHILLPHEADERRADAFVRLRAEIERGLDFAICFTGSRPLAYELDRAGVRYLYESGTGREFPHADANIHLELASDECFRTLASHWKSVGVRRAVIVDFEHVISRNALNALNSVGISLQRILVPAPSHKHHLLSTQQGGLNAVKAFFDLARNRTHPPDAILFYDDYLASGGLVALAATGLRVPEDIRIATFANKGLGPVWFQPLTRLEYDPALNARKIADYVIRFLAGKSPAPPTLSLAFIPGKT